MAGTGTIEAQIITQAAVAISSTGSLVSTADASFTVEMPRRVVNLVDGSGAGTVSRVFTAAATDPGGDTTFDLKTFGGATDLLGREYDLDFINAILVRNAHPDNEMLVNTTVANGYTAFLNGVARVPVGGQLFLVDGSGVGILAPDVNLAITDIAGGGLDETAYEILVVGGNS